MTKSIKDHEGADDLARVAAMADMLRQSANRVAALEDDLAKANAELRKIEEEDFPDLLEEVGLTEVTLTDGTKIKLDKDIRCGISEERRPRAHAWLRNNNFGGLIKSVLMLEFGVGQDNEKQEIAKHLAQDLGLSPIAKETIHPATLKSFIKEQREKGESPPEDVFAISPFNKVKLKAPKH